MTRYDILTKIGMWLKDEYKVICAVDYQNESIKVYFHMLKVTYSVTLKPLYRFYTTETCKFSESDFDYLYRYCCREIEREWIVVLKHGI